MSNYEQPQIRVKLGKRASEELLAIQEHWHYTSLAHTLNIIISNKFKALGLELDNPVIEEEFDVWSR